jgi:hypothetical protein
MNVGRPIIEQNALADNDNLLPPKVIAQEIVADPDAAFGPFRLNAGDSVRKFAIRR